MARTRAPTATVSRASSASSPRVFHRPAPPTTAQKGGKLAKVAKPNRTELWFEYLGQGAESKDYLNKQYPAVMN